METGPNELILRRSKRTLMARKPSGEKFNRTLTKVAGGRSIALTIPKEYLLELGWLPGDELHVVMKKRQKRLVLERVTEQSTEA